MFISIICVLDDSADGVDQMCLRGFQATCVCRRTRISRVSFAVRELDWVTQFTQQVGSYTCVHLAIPITATKHNTVLR